MEISAFQWMTFAIAIVALALSVWANLRDTLRYRTKLRARIGEILLKDIGPNGQITVELEVRNPAMTPTQVADIEVILDGRRAEPERTIQVSPGGAWFPELPHNLPGGSIVTRYVVASYARDLIAVLPPQRVVLCIEDARGHRTTIAADVKQDEPPQGA
jgi:hypothetical protein